MRESGGLLLCLVLSLEGDGCQHVEGAVASLLYLHVGRSLMLPLVTISLFVVCPRQCVDTFIPAVTSGSAHPSQMGRGEPRASTPTRSVGGRPPTFNTGCATRTRAVRATLAASDTEAIAADDGMVLSLHGNPERPA
jgi:hypothetical protein